MQNSLYFCDSNIWLYRFSNDPEQDASEEARKHAIAVNLTSSQNVLISTQVINETCAVLLRKAKISEIQLRQVIQSLYEQYFVIEANYEIVLKAYELRTNYSLSFWDSLIVASALSANANILYSEDMQDGLIITDQLTLINPFKNYLPIDNFI